MRTAVLAVLLSGCGSSGPTMTMMAQEDAATSEDAASSTPDAGSIDATKDSATVGVVDLDGDGLDDANEAAWASEYFPFYGIHPSDGCTTHGVVYRLSPHPKETGHVVIWYDVLFDQDCGGGGHAGDDEVFSVVVDPSRAGAQGILALRAISHQNTPCEHKTTCGSCSGMKACATEMRNGSPYPAVWASKNKHGSYADKGACDISFVCDFGGCGTGAADVPMLVNAGEPNKPLMSDLTTQGFITAQNGWKNMELFHVDPWKPGDFGGAGDVSQDLIDPAFVIDCP